MKQKLAAFLREEPVLIISGVLAIFSMLAVPPNAAYIDYIDFRTLGILFCLMAAVAGLTEAGLFDRVARLLAKRSGTLKRLSLLLVLLCFCTSMLITNDVALITFVPLTLLMLGGAEERCRIFTVVMETIAANLWQYADTGRKPRRIYICIPIMK